MDTVNSDLRIPSEEDAAAASAVTLIWLQEQWNDPIQQERKFHVERLCRSAVAGGFFRECTGSHPEEILIRYSPYSSFRYRTDNRV